MAQIRIFDTTLRDGEQAPGWSMNLEEKLAMARMLEKLRVDVIEAGFPASSPGDFESVRRVGGEVESAAGAGGGPRHPGRTDRSRGGGPGVQPPRTAAVIAPVPAPQ